MVDVIVQISIESKTTVSEGKSTNSGVQVTLAEDVVYVAFFNAPSMTHHDCFIPISYQYSKVCLFVGIHRPDDRYRMFELNMDEYLDEEVESVKHTFATIIRQWDKQVRFARPGLIQSS